MNTGFISRKNYSAIPSLASLYLQTSFPQLNNRSEMASLCCAAGPSTTQAPPIDLSKRSAA